MQTQTQSIDRQQIFTPDHIVDAMIALIPWQPTDTWLEPSAGDGAFIRGLLRHGVSPDMITAIEYDEQYADILASYGVRVIIGSFFAHLDVKANIVIGNPPYTRPGTLSPYYHLFVEAVIDGLNPDYFSFIIPSRWMVGGKGLDKHRERMMNDRHMKKIVHFKNPRDVFPTVGIAGGVNYFMWEKAHNGECEFVNGNSSTKRFLNTHDIILQDNNAFSILEKVQNVSNAWVSQKCLPRKPFGLATNFNDFKPSGVKCICERKVEKFVDPTAFTDAGNVLNKWKVCIPKGAGGHQIPDANGAKMVVMNIFAIEPTVICTETYIVVNAFDTKHEADHFISYMKTKFFRFILGLRVFGVDVNKDKFAWVPDVLDYTAPWTDKELYKKFGLTRQEQAYIESKIKAN